jgi:hypothetical protein
MFDRRIVVPAMVSEPPLGLHDVGGLDVPESALREGVPLGSGDDDLGVHTPLQGGLEEETGGLFGVAPCPLRIDLPQSIEIGR